ncbi:vacuolar protein sorting-associated protein 33B [Rhincodon typus]|uniref:vacuolar protein sorting-associated protein 33B n=1 Tax=Rhincodon typus TaxID=259920 RepID=UPI00202E8B57|nr:vacuolar protein sorting-associated protein 33B [Rhincodon typus]
MAGRWDAPELPDFDILKRFARDQLIYLLEQLPGKKDLFIEADLMSPLDRIANVSILKQHDVEKLYKLENKMVQGVSDQLCFLVRPRIASVKHVAEIVNADKAGGRLRKYKIIFTPQKFFMCETVLEEEGIFGDVTFDEWAFYLLPLDDDIISMELPEFFRDYFLVSDRLWAEVQPSLSNKYLSDIGACESIMKKKTKQDFQELLKSEHALLEGFEIRESTSCVEEHINRQISPLESLRLMCLLSLTENGLISKDYRSLKTQYLQSYGYDHILTFANLKQIGLLTEQQPGETLTAVESTMGKLVTDKAVGKLTDAFSSLARKSHFRALSKRLNLIPRTEEEYDLKVPRNMAYVFSGAYIPLSCKIIEQVLERDSWAGMEEVSRLLNNNEFITIERSLDAGYSCNAQRIILVVFLGGCTFSEIAALRFLGKEKGYKFVFVTTAITNSFRMLESLLES